MVLRFSAERSSTSPVRLLVAGEMALLFPVSIDIALGVGGAAELCPRAEGPTLSAVVAVVMVVMNDKACATLSGSSRRVSRKSIVTCLVSGVLMGGFAPFVTRALGGHGALGTPG